MQSQRCIYRGYCLAPVTIEVDGGRFQARVAVIALDGTRTRSQRFVDLEEFAGKAEADAHAIEAGKALLLDWEPVETLARKQRISLLTVG